MIQKVFRSGVPTILFFVYPPPFATMTLKIADWMYSERGHTSQFPRTRQRLRAIDLNGSSFTPRSDPTVAHAESFRPGSFSSGAAFGSVLSSGRRTSCIRSGAVEVPTWSGPPCGIEGMGGEG